MVVGVLPSPFLYQIWADIKAEEPLPPSSFSFSLIASPLSQVISLPPPPTFLQGRAGRGFLGRDDDNVTCLVVSEEKSGDYKEGERHAMLWFICCTSCKTELEGKPYHSMRDILV